MDNNTEADFWGYVQKSDGCWLWKGRFFSTGYGCFCWHTKKRLAHRAAWEFKFGPIPDGLCACHHCDTKACVNPRHLFLGTHAANLWDAVRKGRRFTRLTPEQVLEIRSSTLTLACLGKKFGVSRGAIFGVRAGLTWKHVQ